MATDPLPLLVLPGMLCDESLWSQVTFPSGHPVRHVVLREPDIGLQAEAVLDGVRGRFVAVGLSLGAIVAFEILRRAPDRVAGLCVMSTNAGAPRPDQYASWRALDHLIADGRFGEAVERTLTGMFASPHPSREEADRYRRMAHAVGPEAARAQLAAQATRADAVAALRSASCPARVLSGTSDALCPPRFHRTIAGALPDARLREVPGAGHLLPWQRPEAVSAALADLLAAVEGSAPARRPTPDRRPAAPHPASPARSHTPPPHTPGDPAL